MNQDDATSYATRHDTNVISTQLDNLLFKIMTLSIKIDNKIDSLENKLERLITSTEQLIALSQAEKNDL